MTRAPREKAKWAAAAFILLLCCTAAALPSQAGTVRGRLFRVAYGRQYPAAYVAVTLVNSQMGRSRPAYTDTSGMYYLLNVPPGVYQLEIWWSRNSNEAPYRFNISVNAGPYTDIAPIQIP
ncbi:MAG TPA: carboxypeptidase-like regulatory domain-containing protein [Terriglobia bacterium]|nr:carboxypeptidase-like regulatory domain-containing protein [Terriglobia bacterium]